MTSTTQIAARQLVRRVGLPDSPVVLDVRTPEEFAAHPLLVPGARRIAATRAAEAARECAGRRAVVVCENGGALWVTRARPKVDRIACPWLIRRLVDPRATFLFVAPADVNEVAARYGATPFDIEDAFWSHRGERCTFDTMIEEFALHCASLDCLARIVRGADTARPDLAPQAAGLLAASPGLSRMFSDDLQQLEAGMALYDSFYRWARDAREETHNWPTLARGAA